MTRHNLNQNPHDEHHKKMRENGMPWRTGLKRATAKRKRIANMKRLKFAQRYYENGGVATDAYRYATGKPAITEPQGYSKSEASTQRWAAVKMKNDPMVQKYLAAIENMIEDEAPAAIQKLAELRDGAEQEGTQLAAAKAILDNYNVATKRKEAAAKRDAGKPHTQTNVLIANMSDEDIEAAIGKLLGTPGATVSGAAEKEMQERLGLPHGGISGVSEPGSVPSGAGDDAEDGGDDEEEGSVPPPPGSPEVNDDYDIVRDSEDSAGPEHQDSDYEQSPGQQQGVPSGD